MIGIIFEQNQGILEFRVDGTKTIMRHSSAPNFINVNDIDGGTDKANSKFIKKIKEHLILLPTEEEKIDFLKEELKSVGWKPIATQRDGEEVKYING